jgi:capsular exopolysaccharide synthesis family protein
MSADTPPPAELPAGSHSKVSTAVVVCHEPRCAQAEQYRAFRTNLTALNRAGGPWAVVFTSSRKGEGKSVTVANVAGSLAELPGQRVCLVDVDFRHPAQAELLGLRRSPGASELLQGTRTLPQVVQSTYCTGLDLIATGDEPRSPAELLGGERFANLLGELKRRYSWVLIDTPPVHPYTDACVLAARCNGAVLVVRMEDTSRDLAQRTMHAIQRAGGKVLGSFLTGLPADREDADRTGRYHVDRSDPKAPDRARARQLAEKRLKDQEEAWIRKQAGENPEKPKGPAAG